MSDSTITYFGFGSLVNRETRPADEPSLRATLSGWQRHWAHHSLGFAADVSLGSGVQTSTDAVSRERSCCSLTVKPSSNPLDTIDGVLVTISVAMLADLDRRETGYDRVSLDAQSLVLDADAQTDISEMTNLCVYVSKPERTASADKDHPILQSYIDCVMAGYETQFGGEGLQRFMLSTEGWLGPIENDRSEPRYPRAVRLTPEQQARYDALLQDTRSEQG